LTDSGSSLAQGFVAMWFDHSLNDAWTNGFHPGVREAGFHPVRINNKDFVGGISDEIMAEIRRSRFVVADYTGQRQSVYFEAGFALGLGLTVIPTCRADDVEKLHFDIKHLNTLLWNTPAELAEGLNRRIRAVIGTGPDAIERTSNVH
jgi:nucleoside 2-deoxyribosyltransferase